MLRSASLSTYDPLCIGLNQCAVGWRRPAVGAAACRRADSETAGVDRPSGADYGFALVGWQDVARATAKWRSIRSDECRRWGAMESSP